MPSSCLKLNLATMITFTGSLCLLKIMVEYSCTREEEDQLGFSKWGCGCSAGLPVFRTLEPKAGCVAIVRGEGRREIGGHWNRAE